jgi:hypothetical protein
MRPLIFEIEFIGLKKIFEFHTLKTNAGFFEFIGKMNTGEIVLEIETDILLSLAAGPQASAWTAGLSS